MRQNWKPLLIVALVVTAAFHLYPTIEFYSMDVDARQQMERDRPTTYYDLQKRSINLGLDLQGGIHLVMEVVTEGLEPDQARDAVDRAQEVVRNRVDQFGVAEPTIQRQGENRIIVELPGLQDVKAEAQSRGDEEFVIPLAKPSVLGNDVFKFKCVHIAPLG